MYDLVQEIEGVFSKPIHGREWAKMLFWDLLDFDRLSMPIPSDVLAYEDRGGIGESMLWAQSGDIRVAMFQRSSGQWNPDSLRQVAGAVALVLRRALLLFGDAAEANWDLVVCIPRTEGQAGECRVFRLNGNSRASRLPELLAGLSPETPTSAWQALRSLWLAADPLTDPTEGVLYGLPRWLRSRLKGSSFEDFVRQAGAHANLTKFEEVALGQRIQAGDRDAWRELVRHNIRLAIWGARRFAKSQLEFEDLVQHSLLGVMRAADRFDPAMDARFSTYAFHWMRQCCQRACEVETTLIRVPSHHHRGLRDYRKQVRGSGVEHRASDRNEEYEHILSLMSLDCYEWAATPVYGEASMDDDPALIFMKSAAREEIANAIISILSVSSERDQEVVYRRFGLNDREEATLEEIGEHLGITRERVRQIEGKQLRRLREELPKKLLEFKPAIEEDDEEGTRGQASVEVQSARKQIVDVIRRANGDIAAVELSRALRIERSVRKSALSGLVSEGVITIAGEGRSARYLTTMNGAVDEPGTERARDGTTMAQCEPDPRRAANGA